jgi:hypothetical protein
MLAIVSILEMHGPLPSALGAVFADGTALTIWGQVARGYAPRVACD